MNCDHSSGATFLYKSSVKDRLENYLQTEDNLAHKTVPLQRFDIAAGTFRLTTDRIVCNSEEWWKRPLFLSLQALPSFTAVQWLDLSNWETTEKWGILNTSWLTDVWQENWKPSQKWTVWTPCQTNQITKEMANFKDSLFLDIQDFPHRMYICIKSHEHP